MANAIYPLSKQRLLEWALLGAGPPAGVADLKVIGVKSDYVYSASHEDLTDVSGAAIVIPAMTLDNVTLALGVVNGDDLVVTGATVGQILDALIVYADWGGGNTLLLAYMDAPTDNTIPASLDSASGILTFDPLGLFRI